jgi:hypothetical protein
MTDLEEARVLNNRYDVGSSRHNIGLFTVLPTTGTCIAITAATQSGSSMTFTVASHSFVANDVVSVSGITGVTTYNGTWTVASVTSTTIVCTNPVTSQSTAGTCPSGCGIGKYGDPVGLTAISGSGTTITYTTSVAHGYLVGMSVTIVGSNISGYNITGTIASVTSTTFTITNSATGTATTTTLSTAGYGAYAGMVHNGVEVTGGSYARLAIAGSTEWNAATPGAPTVKTGPSVSKSTWQFTQASASWGQIVGAGLYDTTDGVWTQFAILTTPQQVNSGNQFQFDQTNQFTLQLGDTFDTF